MINYIEEINFFDLLGKNITDTTIQTIIKDHPNYKVKEIKNFEYVNFNENGMCLCFQEKVLQYVYLYNDNIEGYKQYKGKIPYNVSWDLRNKQIVEKFGDTKSKGGGSVPIWLAYKRLGVEFTFLGKIWEDLENPIIHICIFIPEDNNECSVCLSEIDTNTLVECNNKCRIVQYCSEKCKSSHISYHLKYCV
jgi:hypothetical protein